MEAYPFMWAKNKQISDWCCVAKPDFLRSLPQEARAVLLGAQRGVELALDEIEIVRREYPGVGVLDIAYRKVPSQITDRTGAPFDFIEGVILQGRDSSLRFSKSHFDDARKAIEQQYQEFARAARWGDAEAYHGEKITLQKISAEPPLKVRQTILATKLSEDISAPKSAAGFQHGKAAMPRGIIICGAIACVAVGGFLMAEHLRRHRRAAQKQQSLATA